jgi:CDP-diacylglycerol---serine O-phosphatidyltransferase
MPAVRRKLRDQVRIHVIRGRRAEGESGPLHKGFYLLPNLLTTCGLFSGFYSLISTINGDYQAAALCIVVAHIFDGLDGRIARLTKSSSRFGVEYDSLADVIAFGVAPGALAYKWALEPWGHWGWLAASLYVACGALRLARFNVQVDTGDKRRFVGLPIPAAADTIASTVLLYYFFGGAGATHKHFILLVLIYALAALMVSNVSYESFKGLHLSARQPWWILIALIVGLKFVIAEPQIFLFTAFMLYALSGPVAWLLGYRKRRRAREDALAKAG